MTRWLICLPLSWIATLVGWLLSPLVALCVTERMHDTTVKRYGKWRRVSMPRVFIIRRLSWFATPDNPADEYWWGMYNEDAPFAFLRHAQQPDYDGSAFVRYCCRVMWLCRNAAYGFAQDVLGRPKEPVLYVINRGDVAGWHSTYTRRASSFQFEATIPMPTGRYFTVNIGWKEHKFQDRLMFAGRLPPFGLKKGESA